MVSRDEYFAVNRHYLDSRKTQLFSLFDFLRKKIELRGDVLLSVGCGVAADLELLAPQFRHPIGIDTNPSLIDFCKSTHPRSEFHHTNHVLFFDSLKDDSVDCILALDIDTGVPPLELLRLSRNKLKEGGYLIITERESNLLIYQRLLLKPFLPRLIRESNNSITSYSRFNSRPYMDDRDNFVVVYRK